MKVFVAVTSFPVEEVCLGKYEIVVPHRPVIERGHLELSRMGRRGDAGIHF